MTIAIAVRTSSALVFAADSTLTTQGFVGLKEDGSPLWVPQTYDNAVKLAHDRDRVLMVMVAGAGNLGRTAATDFVAIRHLGLLAERGAPDQGGRVQGLVNEMVEARRAFWRPFEVEPHDWPSSTLLLAAPSAEGDVPRVWRAELRGDGADVQEILTEPGIRLEGSYDEVFTLLYGWDDKILGGICQELGIDIERAAEATQTTKVLRPLDKLNLMTMPTQDAIELAVFLADVQVAMDRFLPGTPACGGPIDVMVLQMAPEPGIVAYPGKVLHHPRRPG